MKTICLFIMVICASFSTRAQSVYKDSSVRLTYHIDSVHRKPFSFTSLGFLASRNYIRLNWDTNEPHNAGTYHIERSGNGTVFKTTGSISSQKREESYSFEDNHPLNGNNFYRIVYTDKDGNKSYSKIIHSVFNSRDALKAYAVNGKVFVNLNLNVPGSYQLAIVNFNGQAVYKDEVKYDGSVNTLDINPNSQLNPGIYSVMLRGNGVILSCQILVK